MDPVAEAAMAVVGVAGLTAVSPLVRKVLNRTSRSAKESPEPVPIECVESIFRVLSDQRGQVANDRLHDALDELGDVYSPDEIDAKLHEAVAEWSRNRPEGAANPPGLADMVKVLRFIVQEFHESKYRAEFANHYRELESNDLHHRSRIENVFVCLQAERSGVEETGNPDERRDGPGFLDFRDKNPDEMLQSLLDLPGNVVILGEPGIGKSTLLRYLAANCAESNSDAALLPLLVPLREIAGGEGEDSLFTEVAARSSQNALQIPMPSGFFQRALDEGRCLVCLDALDEVPLSARRRVTGRVEQLVRLYPGSRFVVTSRRAGYDDGPLDENFFRRYVAQPMEKEDINDFVNNWLGQGTEEAANALAILDNHPDIKALAANSLLLAVFNVVYREVGGHPDALNRTGFYRKATEVLFDRQNKEGQSIEPREIRKDVLAAVAHHMHQSGDETFGKIPLKRFVVRFLEYENPDGDRSEAIRQADEFVKLAERRIGLLVEKSGSGEPQFGFLHSTFREYLTAEYINHRHFASQPDAYWEEIRKHVTNPLWREVILFLLGNLEREYCTYLVEKILASGDARPSFPNRGSLDIHLQLAADALAGQSPMSPELQREIIGRLEVFCPPFYLEPIRSMHAIRALGEMRHISQEVHPILSGVVAVSTTPPGTRIVAATALDKLGYKSEAIEVLTGIARGSDFYDRVDAAVALGRLGEKGVAVEVLTGIARGSNSSDRVYAAAVLGRLGATQVAIDVLTGIATGIARKSVSNDIYRVNAAAALARLGETQAAIDVLTSFVKGNYHDSTYFSAAEELGRLGEIETAVENLTSIARWHYSPRTRVDAAAVLGRQGERETAVDVLTGIARGGNHDRDRIRAAAALDKLGERSTALENLIRIARGSSGDRERIDAARELVTMGERETAVDVLTSIARGSNHDGDLLRVTMTSIARGSNHDGDRVRAAEELGKLGERETAVDVLTSIARGSSDDGDRTGAARELVTMGERETAVDVLTSIARGSNHDGGRVRAAEELGKLGEIGTAVDVLIGIARGSREDSTRLRAAEELGWLGERQAAVDVLTAIARESNDDRTCHTAAAALGKLGERQAAVEVLTSIARGSSGESTRLTAAANLGRLGERQAAVEVLTSIARGGSGVWGRIGAARGLVTMGERETAVEVLTSIARGSSDDITRLCAVEELGWLGEREAARDFLTSIARGSNDEITHGRAAAILWSLGEREVAKDLLTSISEGSNSSYDCVSAATEMDVRGERQAAVEVLTSIARGSKDDMTRGNAAFFLSRLGGRREREVAKDVLNRIIQESDDTIVASSAAKKLTAPWLGGER